MERITEIKFLSKILNLQKKDDINDSSSSFQKSRNNKKISTSLFINSSKNNLLDNNLLHNDASQKFLIHSSNHKNNKTLIKLNLNKKKDSYTIDDIKKIKDELTKKDTIRPFMKSKFLTTKLKIVKKDNTTKSKIAPHIQVKENPIKSPKTIFQKILVNIDKLKKRTSKTIEVMKKNLQVTNEEIKIRREQQRKIKILSATCMQNLGYKTYKTYKKKKNNSFSNNKNPYQTLYITKLKPYNKSISNILPNISTNNNSNTYNNYNQSMSNGSTTRMNLLNETNNINMYSNNINQNINLSSSININTEQKTSTKKFFSS